MFLLWGTGCLAVLGSGVLTHGLCWGLSCSCVNVCVNPEAVVR